jgi:hypothetical protein
MGILFARNEIVQALILSHWLLVSFWQEYRCCNTETRHPWCFERWNRRWMQCSWPHHSKRSVETDPSQVSNWRLYIPQLDLTSIESSCLANRGLLHSIVQAVLFLSWIIGYRIGMPPRTVGVRVKCEWTSQDFANLLLLPVSTITFDSSWLFPSGSVLLCSVDSWLAFPSF